MGIFFRLCNPCLGHMVCGQPFAKSILHSNLMESHFFIGNGRVIIGEADISQIQPFPPVKSGEFVITEASRNFPCPVRPEIEEDYRIFILNRSHRRSIFHHHRRFYKFIRFPSFIGLPNGSRPPCCGQPFPLRQGIIGQFYPVIIVIPVHRIVAAHNGCHFAYADFFHLRFQFLYIAFSAFRRSIPPIQETVRIYFGQAVSFGQFQNTINMCVMAVYTAIGHQPKHMKGGIIGFTIVHRIH